jgi:hypothetical protein
VIPAYFGLDLTDLLYRRGSPIMGRDHCLSAASFIYSHLHRTDQTRVIWSAKCPFLFPVFLPEYDRLVIRYVTYAFIGVIS